MNLIERRAKFVYEAASQCRALEREKLELADMLRRQEQANKGLHVNQPQERTNDD